MRRECLIRPTFGKGYPTLTFSHKGAGIKTIPTLPLEICDEWYDLSADRRQCAFQGVVEKRQRFATILSIIMLAVYTALFY